jgi:hypothetical protein
MADAVVRSSFQRGEKGESLLGSMKERRMGEP